MDDVPDNLEVSSAEKIEEEDDPVVSEVPVYLNHLQDPPFLCGEIFVLLNSLRHSSRPYGDQGQLASVEVNEESNRLRINYTLNTRSDTYDSSSTHDLRRHSLIAKPTSRDSSSASYCVGVMSDGVLSLVPVSSLCNVRPIFDHIDAEVASRKTVSEENQGGTKPLTGKALHYQQLVKSIKAERAHWRKLDHYDYDSVEAADLFQEHILVNPHKMDIKMNEDRRVIKEMKTRELEFECSQDQYLYKLSSGSWGAAEESSSTIQELTRLDFSRQIEAIMKRFQVVKFSDVMQALPANTRARYSEQSVLDQLNQCALCVQGNWIVLSHLSPHRPQMWDTRDAMLVLLHSGREVNFQTLSGISGLPKEDLEEIVRHVCALDVITNSYRLKVRRDQEFVTEHPDIIKKHEAAVQSMIARLKAKKAQAARPVDAAESTASTFTKDEIEAMSETAKIKLMDSGALTTDEIRQALQASTRDHFVSEAAALEILRVLQAIPVRERWALPSRGGSGDIDTLRLALIGMYRDRDALTKSEILHAFNEALGTTCDLSDHDLRKLIKEFASNDRGYWVFNGKMIAERRPVKREDDQDMGL